MNSINEVSIDHIQRLKAPELGELLHLLLRIESQKNNLLDVEISVPQNITTADGGRDGSIKWDGTPAKTYNIPNSFTIFQNKATNLDPKDCFEEILQKEKKGEVRKLKTEIESLVIDNGAYVLFTTQPMVDKQKAERIIKFREAIKVAGRPNWDSFQIEIYDANRIKDWVNQYIGAVTLVQKFCGVSRPISFMTWQELGRELRESETPFQRSEIVSQNINSIRSAASTSPAIRIYGHSGLGKTRLIFEALKDVEGQQAVTSGLVYYDYGIGLNAQEISRFIISHRDHQAGTIVVDNCDSQTHLNLSRKVAAQGHLKIITIGFDDDRSIEDPKIRLDRNDQRDLVSQIVEQKLGKTHNHSDKDYVKRLSEGYPWMAVKFCTGVLVNGMSNLSQYSLDEFIRKLLFNTKEGEKEYGIICACSVFSAFGFRDDSLQGVIRPEVANSLQDQMDFIRTELCDGDITDSTFRWVCNKFLKEDIIERRGTFYMVKPTVLAIHLASQWMMVTSPEKIRTVIERLKGIGLEEKFVDRLSDLDQLDKAKRIVSDLWGTGGFFGSAEVLSTAWGSLLFRYVVEVNPEDTLISLEKFVSAMSTEELKALEEPRRNLVWALEKLVFRKETFNVAARILFRFAVAENETWANNATSQFKQLFHLYLAGTEVGYEERMKVARWGFEQKEKEFKVIGIAALSSGLNYGHFSRGGGAESQGSGVPLKDYEPATWQEIFQYWTDILAILVPIASASDNDSQLARRGIVAGIPSLIRYGKTELIAGAITTIHEKRAVFWPEALEELRMTVNLEDGMPEDVRSILTHLIELLTPKDLRTQLYLTVTAPEWDYAAPSDIRGDKQVEKVHLLAEKIVSENLPVDEILENLTRGEQRMGFVFGKRLGELWLAPEKMALRVLNLLSTVPRKEQNPEFLTGFLIGADKLELIRLVYDKLLNDESVAHLAFYFARVNKLELEQIERLFGLLEKFQLPVTYFNSFQYGGPSSSFQVQEVLRLAERLRQYGITGRWVSLSIVYSYCYSNEDQFEQCRLFLRNLIAGENLGFADDVGGNMEFFQWGEVVKKLLDETGDGEFARIIMTQIIELYGDYRDRNGLEHYTPKVLALLLDQYFDETWPILGEAFLGDNYMFLIKIRGEIGTKNGWMGGDGSLFADLERNQKLLQWCAKNPEGAPKQIAHMMPLQALIDGKTTWHPLSREIIDKYGDQKLVLDALSANMGTYGSVGSRVGYLEMLRNLVGELREHPIGNVSQWAKQYYSYYEKEIKREQISNEEDSIR